jgi:hypothetical protein
VRHWVQYGLVCGGGGVSGCHMAFICGVDSGVLLQWNGISGGRGEGRKEGGGWVESVDGAEVVGLDGLGTFIGVGAASGAGRPRWVRM